MPAAAVMQPVNNQLANPASGPYRALAAAAQAASSCQEVVNALNLAQHLADSGEIQRELGVLPTAIDQQILQAVRDATGRGDRVIMSWAPAAAGSQLSVHTSQSGNVSHIVVVSPDGRTF
jgi:hypothetical protein